MDDADRRQLVVATTNEGKLAEFRELLPPEIGLLSLSDLSLSQVDETGSTFEDNARDKAVSAAARSGHLAIADDSGLEVDALDGRPGVRSARFAGEDATDEQNRKALLDALKDLPPPARQARFRCVVALAAPSGRTVIAEGVCEGSIALEQMGHHGFGYDSIFCLADGRTIAQLPADEKNVISHRAQAFRAIIPSLHAAFGRATPEEGR